MQVPWGGYMKLLGRVLIYISLSSVFISVACAEIYNSDIFTQNESQVCRKFASTIDVTDARYIKPKLDLFTKAMTHIADDMKNSELGLELERQFKEMSEKLGIELELPDVKKAPELLDGLSDQFHEVMEELKTYRNYVKVSDYLPKAMFINLGGRFGTFARFLGGGTSLNLAFIIMPHRHHCINKEDLNTLMALSKSKAAALDFLIQTMDEADRNLSLYKRGFSLFSEVETRKTYEGHELVIRSVHDIDIEPTLMFNIGLGVSAGPSKSTGVRLGMGFIFWQHDRILGPKDLYGDGISISLDGRFFKWGVNGKLTAINRDYEEDKSPIDFDYIMIAASTDFSIVKDKQIVNAKVKFNYSNVKDPGEILAILKLSKIWDMMKAGINAGFEKTLEEYQAP